jgi:hypothetical protein
MDKKNFTISLLSLTAVALFMANYFAAQPAQALQTIKDRDYSMVTAATQAGGDSLYVLDNRSGRVAVFAYDPAAKTLVPRVAGDLSVGFGGGGQ